MLADVVFIAGEASGDAQAALLARAMRDIRPDLEFAGAGGDAMRAAGVRVLFDTTELAGIGPLPVLLRLPKIFAAYLHMDRLLRADPPGLLVPIDSGSVNLRLLARLRRRGYAGDAVYYFPPAAWLDDAGTARRTAALATPLAPFVHQRDFYRRLSLPVEWFGHPMVSSIAQRAPSAIRDPISIAILPGSRREEVRYHLPVLAQAATGLRSSRRAAFRIVAASDERARQIQALWPRLGGPTDASVERRPAVEVLADADLSWTASGTAVLEAALVGVPQSAFYVVSPAQYRIAQRRVPAIVRGFISLPNLVLGRQLIPELKQRDFTAQRLLAHTLALLDDERARREQVEGYAELRRALGPPDALARIAAYLLDRLARANAR